MKLSTLKTLKTIALTAALLTSANSMEFVNTSMTKKVCSSGFFFVEEAINTTTNATYVLENTIDSVSISDLQVLFDDATEIGHGANFLYQSLEKCAYDAKSREQLSKLDETVSKFISIWSSVSGKLYLNKKSQSQ